MRNRAEGTVQLSTLTGFWVFGAGAKGTKPLRVAILTGGVLNPMVSNPKLFLLPVCRFRSSFSDFPL